jgi:hypothetical protein
LIEEDFEAEARRILSASKSAGIILNLLGALAIRLHSPTARKYASSRQLSDIDFFGLAKQREEIIDLFKNLGYSPAEQFNFSNFPRALKFFGPQERHVDIWLDKFEMCHTFDFAKRLDINADALSVEDLLMTKLQIVELNKKDVIDVICLLADHELGKGDRERLDVDYIASLCQGNWNVYRTFTMNIQKILDLIKAGTSKIELDDNTQKTASSKLGELLGSIEAKPKTVGWKLRAKIGEKKTWYESPTLTE